MIIESSAPARADLSGGTLDIWPIYLYHKDAVTINAAINLYARVKIIPRDDKKIIIESKDTNLLVKASSLVNLKEDSSLPLLTRLIKFFAPVQGFNMITSSDVPKGSGLGGSSALAITASGALNRFSGNKYKKDELINITKNIEGQVIKVPPGDQDYYPALYGGVNAIWLTVCGVRLERLDIDRTLLEDSLILCYSGESRFSGTTNWEIMKSHIDGDISIYNKLERIKKTSLKMRTFLLNGDRDGIGKMLKEEWANRRILCKGVTNKRIDSIISSAIKNGAVSAKLCGAGGGGCGIFFVKPGYKNRVADLLVKKGCRVFIFKIAEKGLKITES